MKKLYTSECRRQLQRDVVYMTKLKKLAVDESVDHRNLLNYTII